MTRQGFTLIELLITLTIIGILSGIGIVSYNDFNKRQTIKGAALNFKNDLRVAQNKAFNGEKSTCSTLLGYQVSFPGSSSYRLAAACGDGSYIFLPTVNLPANVTFSPTPSSLLFKVIGQGVTNPQTICFSGFSSWYKLAVTNSGEIQDGGLTSACP